MLGNQFGKPIRKFPHLLTRNVSSAEIKAYNGEKLYLDDIKCHHDWILKLTFLDDLFLYRLWFTSFQLNSPKFRIQIKFLCDVNLILPYKLEMMEQKNFNKTGAFVRIHMYLCKSLTLFLKFISRRFFLLPMVVGNKIAFFKEVRLGWT